MSNENLKLRTKQFALGVIKFVESLPHDDACRVLGRQLLRSGTSVAANYRAACRAKSTADFISKMGNVEEEADESGDWLELLIEGGRVPQPKADPLLIEANELVAIAVASINTARKSVRPPMKSLIPHSDDPTLRISHFAFRTRTIPDSALRTPH